MPKQHKPIPIGTMFGSLTVIGPLQSMSRGRYKYQCRCSCGATQDMWSYNINRNKTCKKCVSHYMKPPGEGSFRILFNKTKHSAQIRHIVVEITYNEFKTIVAGNCFYCDSPPRDYNPYINQQTGKLVLGRTAFMATRAWIKANGIDRLDNSIGYTVENCVPCCAQCNTMKMDYTLDEFINHIYAITKHMDSIK